MLSDGLLSGSSDVDDAALGAADLYVSHVQASYADLKLNLADERCGEAKRTALADVYAGYGAL